MMNPASNGGGEGTVRLTDPVQRTDSTRLPLLIAIICGVVAIIAVILAAVALSRNNDGITVQTAGNSGSQAAAQTGSTAGTNRIWTIAIGHDYGAHEYINQEGYLAGFNHDLIKEVCSAAGIICRTVWEPYVNCWKSVAGQHARGSEGLLGRWYDACTGWYVTVGRTEVYSFSESFLKGDESFFLVKKTDTFNASDLAGLTKPIGFLDGWASDEKCLARQSTITNSVLPVDKIKHFETTVELTQALRDGTIAAAFTGKADLQPGTEFKRVGTAGFSCLVRGNAMMTRKDSPFNENWNRGFRKVKDGQYRRLCKAAATKHGSKGAVVCVD